MTTPARHSTSEVHAHEALNYVATEPLDRDLGQSRRLHEPHLMITTIDPISGKDIDDLAGRPCIEDGNMVIYFESEKTRQQYLDTPLDHPLPLPDNPTDEGYAEG